MRIVKSFVPSLALFACAAAVLPVHADSFVVVEARGVGFKPGTVIDSAKPLALKQGQHVTLISNSGVTLKLDGPYDKPPAIDRQQGVDITTTLASLATARQSRLAEVGTTRGTVLAKLPSAWLIDASHGGNACLQESAEPVFWRPSADSAAKLTVMPDDRSWKAEAAWPRGQNRISVTTDVPMHGGAAYLIGINGVENAVTVNTVPTALANDQMRAAWMADKGCEAQAEALLRPAQ